MIWLSRHWFPGEPVTERTMGAAIWAEQRYWQHMAHAVAAGINKAFSGK